MRGLSARCARRSVALALVATLAACATDAVPVGSARVDDAFVPSAARFSTGTKIDFAVAPREADGRLALCGAWAVSNETAQVIPFTRQAVASGQVQIDGRTVLRDPSRFSRLPGNGPLVGAEARCLATETAWQPGFETAEPNVRFVRQVFDRDVDDASSFAGVIFREVR